MVGELRRQVPAGGPSRPADGCRRPQRDAAEGGSASEGLALLWVEGTAEELSGRLSPSVVRETLTRPTVQLQLRQDTTSPESPSGGQSQHDLANDLAMFVLDGLDS